MKKKVLLYSDGLLFGGSEFVVVNILKSHYLNNSYDIFFAYRYHKDYQMHIESLFSKAEREKFYSIYLLSVDYMYSKIDSWFKNNVIRFLFKSIIAFIDLLQIWNIYNYCILNKFLKKHKFDLIHINNGGYPAAESCLVMAKVAKDYGMKVIMQINNIPSQSKKYWDRIVKKSVDIFIIASKYTSDRIVKVRNITDGNIYTLRDNVKYVSPTKQPAELKKTLGIKPDSIVLIQVALLLLYKGQIHILEALTHMRDKNREFFEKTVLVLIGSGEMEDTLKKYISDHDLGKHVIMLGYRNDYIDYLNMADVLVHPSRANEDMPLIILSAMSLKKSIVSCDFAGIPEEVENMKSGILLDPHSKSFIEDLCNAILIAYKNRIVFGERGRKIFEDEFSEAKYEERLSDLYDKFLNSN